MPGRAARRGGPGQHPPAHRPRRTRPATPDPGELAAALDDLPALGRPPPPATKTASGCCDHAGRRRYNRRPRRPDPGPCQPAVEVRATALLHLRRGRRAARVLTGSYFEHHVKVVLGHDLKLLTDLAQTHGAHVSRNARRRHENARTNASSPSVGARLDFPRPRNDSGRWWPIFIGAVSPYGKRSRSSWCRFPVGGEARAALTSTPAVS